VDGSFNFSETNSTASFTAMVAGLGRHIPVLPAVECNAPPNYVTAVQRFVGRFAPGVVVKANLRQLPNVAAWVASQNWAASNVDLVISAGHAADYDPAMFEGFVLHAIQTNIQNGNVWRSVTLAASSAPKDHSALALGSNVIPRLDWQLWNAVAPQLRFQVDFGDYGIAFPDLAEVPGIAMTRATVSVRYTIDNDWIVLKGRPTTGAHGQPMGDQYRAHAQHLLREPHFDQLQNCWGDTRVRQIAATTPPQGAGNRTQWVAITVNRHLSLVADRLP
jgi:hypothetical protein